MLNFLPTAMTTLWLNQVTSAHKLIRTTVQPSNTHHPYARTPRCLQLLLTSQPRRARAAGLVLRLPTSQPAQATASFVAAGHVGGEEAACRGQSLVSPQAIRGAHGVASRLCLWASLLALSAHVGGRGV